MSEQFYFHLFHILIEFSYKFSNKQRNSHLKDKVFVNLCLRLRLYFFIEFMSQQLLFFYHLLNSMSSSLSGPVFVLFYLYLRNFFVFLRFLMNENTFIFGTKSFKVFGKLWKNGKLRDQRTLWIFQWYNFWEIEVATIHHKQ